MGLRHHYPMSATMTPWRTSSNLVPLCRKEPKVTKPIVYTVLFYIPWCKRLQKMVIFIMLISSGIWDLILADCKTHLAFKGSPFTFFDCSIHQLVLCISSYLLMR